MGNDHVIIQDAPRWRADLGEYFHSLSALLGERPPKRPRLMLTRDELHLLLNAGMRRRNMLIIRILLATAVRWASAPQPEEPEN